MIRHRDAICERIATNLHPSKSYPGVGSSKKKRWRKKSVCENNCNNSNKLENIECRNIFYKCYSLHEYEIDEGWTQHLLSCRQSGLVGLIRDKLVIVAGGSKKISDIILLNTWRVTNPEFRLGSCKISFCKI